MKKLLFLLLFSPLMGISQTPDYLIFEIETLRPTPANVVRIEKGLASHNKQYHPSGLHGARVYEVLNGPNSGDYKWVMGPTHWSALDTRPASDMHDSDWRKKVGSLLQPVGNTTYVRADPNLSRFPADFKLNKLLIRYVDVLPGKSKEVEGLLSKIQKVYAEKEPTATYGVYYNELPNSSEANDLTIVDYFDKYKWMSEEYDLGVKFEEIYGAGSWESFWNDWRKATGDQSFEIWEFRGDLSGMSSDVKVAERQ